MVILKNGTQIIYSIVLKDLDVLKEVKTLAKVLKEKHYTNLRFKLIFFKKLFILSNFWLQILRRYEIKQFNLKYLVIYAGLILVAT